MSAQTIPLPASAADALPADDHVFLIGRPPVGELMTFVRTMAVNGQASSQGQLAEVWRRANDHVRRLERTEAGYADNAAVAPLPDELRSRRLRLLNEPVYQRAFQTMPSDVVMVELDRLIVYQKYIDLAHVARIRARLSPELTPDELFDVCLPASRENPPVRMLQTGPNAYSFLSPSSDFRFLHADLIGPDRTAQWPATGPVHGVLGLVFGYGSNFMTALSAEGRLILGNGSHRAYALREHGVTHVPCIVQKVTRREELDLVATPEVIRRADLYLRAPRPPLLKDYLDPALRMIVPVVRRNRMVKVSFSVEAVDIPA